MPKAQTSLFEGSTGLPVIRSGYGTWSPLIELLHIKSKTHRCVADSLEESVCKRHSTFTRNLWFAQFDHAGLRDEHVDGPHVEMHQVQPMQKIKTLEHLSKVISNLK
jgi:hypothetical protein